MAHDVPSPAVPPSVLTVLALALALLACGGSSSPSEPEAAVFRVRACGEDFRVRIADPAVAAHADALAGRGNVEILTGTVRAGDGGVNAPWSWHLDPASIGFAEITIELCDACPSYVEETLPEWLGRTYCPWSTEVLGRG